MNRYRGFSLIEVVAVMAIIAITIGLAGPRIGAGLGTLELHQAEQAVKSYMKMARFQARRSDQDCYLFLDNTHQSVSILAPDMKLVRQQTIPSSVSFVLPASLQSITMNVAPSGIISGQAVRLRGRTGEAVIPLR